MTKPFGGTLVNLGMSRRDCAYSFSFCWVDVMAPSTDSLFTRDLMLEAVPYSPTSMFVEFAI